MADYIDDALYSRQRYVLGDTAMERMANSKVFLVGLGSVGIEIAKNLVLAGVQTLVIQDSKEATIQDVGTQFFVNEKDAMSKCNRAEASRNQLAELNPYVKVEIATDSMTTDSELQFLQDFKCVIMTDAPLKLQLHVNNFCRTQDPPIKFISSDVYGAFCWMFCDFGDRFEVFDSNGEEPREMFIDSISKDSPGVVTCHEKLLHGLESGDVVMLTEVDGMTALNGHSFKVDVLTPTSFSICDTTKPEYGEYVGGGIFRQVKIPITVHHKSMVAQIEDPDILIADLGKPEVPYALHLGMLALHDYWERNSYLPTARDQNCAQQYLELADKVNQAHQNKFPLDQSLLKKLALTAEGCLQPLAAFLGGVVAQEALTAISGKFTPLQQWLYLDCADIVDDNQDVVECNNRYTSLEICIGRKLLDAVANLNVFLVGCGAIGCEMMKNFALLGVGSKNGMITITDNDLIEKSNLNRQFLFRSHHIQKPKSAIAAEVTKSINPDLQIKAHQTQVWPQTEDVFSDDFFESQNVVVAALDNVESRRYVDSRCVKNCCSLLDSGTMGTKGHVQAIVANQTESYATQHDPLEQDIPYCTLKSFPANIEHTIQWARDKFESLFTIKPSAFNEFWSIRPTIEEVITCLEDAWNAQKLALVTKLLETHPKTWSECISLARLKFEKYFNHKAKHLLHAFPMDTKLKDGSSFWQLPKRPPTPLVFDSNNSLHLAFIVSTAKLLAAISDVKVEPQDVTEEFIQVILASVAVPEFVANDAKKIETNVAAVKRTQSYSYYEEEIMEIVGKIRVNVQSWVGSGRSLNIPPVRNLYMAPLIFEKDDDSNGHIDFITTASNLRANMYGIENADRRKTKKIAGKIIPAIATTTAAVAGLVSLELLKVVKGLPINNYRNCFLNLALPAIVLSEPAPAPVTQIGQQPVNMWDRWEVYGSPTFLLHHFIEQMKLKTGLDISMVVEGSRAVYIPIMSGHYKRISQPLVSFLKPGNQKSYTDLFVGFMAPEAMHRNYAYERRYTEQMGPPVRYYFAPKD